MVLYNLDKFVKTLISKTIDQNSIVVDATCGNGNDTFFLAQKAQKVYAFDVQQEAINNTKKRCEAFDNIIYVHDSHAEFDKYLQENIDLIIYNLGYLPNSTNDQIITTSDSTITSITQGIEKLNKNKLMIITLYTGHDDGREANIVSDFLYNLNNKEYLVMKYQFCNLNNPPYVMVVEKK